MTRAMEESSLWRLTLRLFILAWMITYYMACLAVAAATMCRLDSPFNLRRYV